MGYIKDIANQPKIQSFPSSTFEISDEVPASQCSEAKIESDIATTTFPPGFLTDPGRFVGWNLAGKTLTITASVGGNTGTWPIIANTDDILAIAQDIGNGDPVSYYVHNGGSLILTRNMESFANFISAARYAYTIKANKLHTNIPSAQLQNACTILFAPLT